MNPLCTLLIMAVLLAGCVYPGQESAVRLTPATERAAKQGDITEADIVAAVTAARHSKYFPGTERYGLGKVNPREINVLYYDIPGTCVIVKRIRGRWKAVDHAFWQS